MKTIIIDWEWYLIMRNDDDDIWYIWFEKQKKTDIYDQ